MNRFFVLSFAAVSFVYAAEPVASPTSAPTTAVTPTPGYSMANCVHPFDPANAEKTAVGYQFWFADAAFANGNTVKMSVVGPHLATHPPHRHAEEEYFFVLEGTAEFYLDGERKKAGAMTLFYCPSWHEHGIRNVGDSELKYLVIKKYLKAPATPKDVQQMPGAAHIPGAKEK